MCSRRDTLEKEKNEIEDHIHLAKQLLENEEEEVDTHIKVIATHQAILNESTIKRNALQLIVNDYVNELDIIMSKIDAGEEV